MAQENWSAISEELDGYRAEFDKSFKCINKTQKPGTDTINKHLLLLESNYNKTVILINQIKNKLTTEHLKECITTVNNLQNKILKTLEEIKLSFVFPPNDKTIELPKLELIMADAIKFLETASKILPDFDGSFTNLRKFIDAINLLVSIKGTNPDSLLINIINTKITSNIRNKIEGLSSIESVIEKLRNVVKGDSADTLITKLNAIKQHDKNKTQYVKEIEQLSNELANTYISDGMTEGAANKIATRAAIKSVIQNANSERVKLIMQAGTFNSIEEVTSKFLEIEDQPNNLVMFVGYRNRGRNRQNYNHNNYRNYNNRNNNNYNNAHNNHYQTNRGRNYRNDYNRNNRNDNDRSNNNNRRPNFNRNIRVINSDEQGNGDNPLITHLGEN